MTADNTPAVPLTAAQLEQQLSADYLDTAIRARELSKLAIEQGIRDAKAGRLRDPGKTAVSAIVASGTALDKRLVLEGRPTQITEHRDVSQILASAARRVGLVIDTTATDITDDPQRALEPGNADGPHNGGPSGTAV